MLGVIPRLKRLFVEPRVYALVLESKKGAVLHLGIHYSLDEAINTARPHLARLVAYKPGEKFDIGMWAVLSGNDVVRALLTPEAARAEIMPAAQAPQPDAPEKLIEQQASESGKDRKMSLQEKAKLVRRAKNLLMQDLIEQGDETAVQSSKDILNKSERDLIIDKIKKTTHAGDTAKQAPGAA